MSLSLSWSNEQEAYPIKEELIEKLEVLLQLAGVEEKLEKGDVSLTFVDDEQIHKLNKQYRGIDRPTDVLSFAMHEEGEGEMRIIYNQDDFEIEDLEEDEESEFDSLDDQGGLQDQLGDIIISVPTAISQAQEYGHSLERELCFLFVHGFLHLIGYDHENDEDEKEMFTKQEMILQKAGITR